MGAECKGKEEIMIKIFYMKCLKRDLSGSVMNRIGKSNIKDALTES